jgi:multidrug resistance efflux pump
VKRGTALATLASPDVALAQRELVDAAKNFTTQEALDAVRRKLLRMGVPPVALARTEKTGIVDGKLPLWAWIGGTVVDSKLVRGLYVEAGTELVTITDPTRRWVLAEVDDTDRISVGMAARLVIDGKPIAATVAAVYRHRYVRFDVAKPLPIDTPVRVEIDFSQS